MNTVEAWHAITLGENAVKALKKNGFDAIFVSKKEDAAEKIISYIKPGITVGIGGSMTITDLNIKDRIIEKGAELLDHNNPELSPEEKRSIRRRQLLCDLFISSSNAVTLDGDIVNVDGNGNRIAALTFGPEKIIVVIGINKITLNVDEAFTRIEQYAAPMNNKRLEMPNPCIKTGICQDCSNETRICNIYQILRKKPRSSDFTVIVAGEPLGY